MNGNMMQPEQLFLLEFLVDSVYIHRLCGKEISCRDWMLGGQTVVTFQFLNFQAQAISDSDFPTTGCPGGGPQKFESGKSCLFSIPEKELQSVPGEFIIYIGIYKKQPAGILPESAQVGEAKIDITNEFSSVLADIMKNPNETPASNAIKDTFVIHNPGTNEPVGMIRLFIRLSCFGKSIVTEFSLGNGQSYLFKGNEENVYRCQEVNPAMQQVPPCVLTGNTMGSGGQACLPGGAAGYPPVYGYAPPQPAQQAICPSAGMPMGMGMGAGVPLPYAPVYSPQPCAADPQRPRQNAQVCAAPAGGGGGGARCGAAGAPSPACSSGGGGPSSCPGQRALPCGRDGGGAAVRAGKSEFFVQIPEHRGGPSPDVACYKLTKSDGPPAVCRGGAASSPADQSPCAPPAPDAYVLRIKRRCGMGCAERDQVELELQAPPKPPEEKPPEPPKDDAAGAKKDKGGKKGKGKKGKGKKGKGKKGKKGKKK